MRILTILTIVWLIAHVSGAEAASNHIVYYEPGEFSGWPANKGAQAWHWGDEMLVGFVNGTHEEKDGHDWAPPLRLLFARSTDGGETWTSAKPRYVGGGPAPGEIDFAHPDFALMIFDHSESYYISYDRGRAWWGPYAFGRLFRDSPIARDEFSARTDYIVNSAREALFFLSSRRQLLFREDYTYVARTRDGGASFELLSYLDPLDLDRKVMPSTVRIGERGLVTCVRRRRDESNWIECYRSRDDGASWVSVGQVDDTGQSNGSPPALVRLPGGQLVCVYAVRRASGRPSISAKVSLDDGSTWGREHRLRTDYVDTGPFNDVDMGYPRAFVRPDGKIVAVYYWATARRPEQHIAATIFAVETQTEVEIGPWRPGLAQEQAAGSDRLLLLTLHYVENGSRFKEPRVRYGGQRMTRLVARDQKEGARRTHVAVFYLKESDLEKAAHGRFRVDWTPSRPDHWEAASLFLTNVDQVDPFGGRDARATKSRRLGCGGSGPVRAGDAAIVAATARKRGAFTLGDRLTAETFDLSRGGIGRGGNGVVGIGPAAGVDRIVVTHPDPGSMAAACIQVRQKAPSVG